MARVGLTEDIRNGIISKIRDLYQPAVTDATNSKPNIAERAYKNALEQLGTTRSALEAVPVGFIKYSKSLEFRWVPTDGSSSQVRGSVHYADERPIALLWNDSYNNNLFITDESVLQELTDWRNRMNAAERARTEAVSSIKTVMNQCATLNQLLKLVPDLKNVVPQHLLTKVEAKMERRTMATIEVDAKAIEDVTNNLAVGILAGIV